MEVPTFSCNSEKRERPSAERADLRPALRRRANRESNGASGVAEPARQIFAVTARERHFPTRHRHDRAKSVPLRLVDPLLTDGSVSVAVASIGRWSATRAAVLPQEQPVLRITVERGRHERPTSRRSPSRRTVETSVALLLEQLVRSTVPDLDRAGAVLAGRDSPSKSPYSSG